MRLDPAKFFENVLPPEELEIPLLGGTVLVRGLSAAEQDDYEIKLATGQFAHGYRAYLAYHCTVNDDGSLFFDREGDDGPIHPDKIMEDLSKLPWGILDAISTASGRLSGIPELQIDLGAGKKKSDTPATDGSGE